MSSNPFLKALMREDTIECHLDIISKKKDRMAQVKTGQILERVWLKANNQADHA